MGSGTESSLPLSPAEIRKVVETCFLEAKTEFSTKRKQKILENLAIARNELSHDYELHSAESPRNYPQTVLSRRERGRKFKPIEPNHGVLLLPRGKATMKNIKNCPNGLAWVRVRTNMRAADRGNDTFFVPYIGESDAHQNFSNQLASDIHKLDSRVPDDISDLDDMTRDISVLNAQDASRTNMTSLRSDKNSKNAKAALILNTHKSGKVSKRKWNRAAMRIALKKILAVLKCRSVRPFASVACDVFGLKCSAHVASCYRTLQYRAAKYEEVEKEEQNKRGYRSELLEILDGSRKTSGSEALKGDSIPFFICRQCYTYNCFLHGNQTAKPSQVGVDKTRKDSSTRQAMQEIESKCADKVMNSCRYGTENHQLFDTASTEVPNNGKVCPDTFALVMELSNVFGSDSCRISYICRNLFTLYRPQLKTTCRSVGRLLKSSAGVGSLEPDIKSRRRPRKSHSSKCRRKKMPAEDETGLRGGLRRDFEPCQHSGACTAKSCSCVQNGVNCEKFCSCNHIRSQRDRIAGRVTCGNAFQGCTCKSAMACISNACICYSWRRECDPDLCRACHDCKEGQQSKSCRNVGLLNGVRQRIVVGHSSTHGWGAFSTAPICKNDIIGEYVGEVVDQEYADRRGRLYDEVQYSFLFNITDEFALDSTRIGNKLRYCNHAFEPNCEARLMRVAGDIRVGLYAKRDILKYEELFFDYKYKFGPDWAVGAKRKKLSHVFKQQRCSVPTSMKMAVTPSQVERGCRSTETEEGEGFDSEDNDDDEYMVKVKAQQNSKKMKWTRSQGKHRPNPQGPQFSIDIKPDEQKPKQKQNGNSSSMEGQPLSVKKKNTVSIWRGVLKRVAQRPPEVSSDRASVKKEQGSASFSIGEKLGKNMMSKIRNDGSLRRSLNGRPVSSAVTVNPTKSPGFRIEKSSYEDDDRPGLRSQSISGEFRDSLNNSACDSSSPQRKNGEPSRILDLKKISVEDETTDKNAPLSHDRLKSIDFKVSSRTAPDSPVRGSYQKTSFSIRSRLRGWLRPRINDACTATTKPIEANQIESTERTGTHTSMDRSSRKRPAKLGSESWPTDSLPKRRRTSLLPSTDHAESTAISGAGNQPQNLRIAANGSSSGYAPHVKPDRKERDRITTGPSNEIKNTSRARKGNTSDIAQVQSRFQFEKRIASDLPNAELPKHEEVKISESRIRAGKASSRASVTRASLAQIEAGDAASSGCSRWKQSSECGRGSQSEQEHMKSLEPGVVMAKLISDGESEKSNGSFDPEFFRWLR